VRIFRAGAAALCLTLVFVLSLSGAADIKIPPSPDRWATDTAGFLSSSALQALDQRLAAFSQQTGHQVIVYIGASTEGYPIEEFATKTFEAWKVGRRGLDDGTALFIMAEDHAVRIEVGYGLEGVIPDITAGRIINDILIPKIRAGDRDAAVDDAVSAILGAISGEPVPAAAPQPHKHSGQGFLIILGIIIFAVIFFSNPSLALWLLVNMLGGGGGGRFRGGGWGGGGGFSGGGGGFSGGGGRSGGGGASGHW
jgi:uncharacterized protein